VENIVVFVGAKGWDVNSLGIVDLAELKAGGHCQPGYELLSSSAVNHELLGYEFGFLDLDFDYDLTGSFVLVVFT